jgi:hypothetical protein
MSRSLIINLPYSFEHSAQQSQLMSSHQDVFILHEAFGLDPIAGRDYESAVYTIAMRPSGVTLASPKGRYL